MQVISKGCTVNGEVTHLGEAERVEDARRPLMRSHVKREPATVAALEEVR